MPHKEMNHTPTTVGYHLTTHHTNPLPPGNDNVTCQAAKTNAEQSLPTTTGQGTPTRRIPQMVTHNTRPWNPKMNHTCFSRCGFDLPPPPKQDPQMTEHARPQEPRMKPTPTLVGVIIIFNVFF
ncbi:hypothetical protein BS47DRAFT_1363110 [Hydnum rufescens UP504]|uniref:Uncharacterized protein n=1 Tax=Hydnum rufescens UP504 TaxID=1448309 RepID=A0A9P6AV44_9AGAM|nr:hypothetical protein BS47DRAFT_1363110 [Hydnum rufescens UP504]